MPNRILREGILESERIHRIGPMAELFYRRLMSIVDDYGRYAYDIPVLLSRCFPRRPQWADEETISVWAGECRDAGLLTIYEVNNHKYLEVSDFRQPIRSQKSKWPEMSSGCVADATQMKTGFDIPISDANTHTNTNTNTNSDLRDFENLPFDTLETPRIAIVKPPVEEWFAEFWEFYWRKVDKANALKAFKKYATDEETKDRIIAAVKAQSQQYLARDSEHRPHAATWLNARRYEEDPEVYQPGLNGKRPRGLTAEEIAQL